MSKSNVCLVGLSKQFTDHVGQQLAIKLEMFYANIDKLFEYELTDLEKVEELCGIEFLMKEQVSIVKRVCSYDNTLMTIQYPLLNNSDIYKLIKDNCLLIYVGVSKKMYDKDIDFVENSKTAKIIEKDAFEDRDFLCKKMSDISISCDDNMNIDESITKIVEKIVEFYS